MGLFLDLFIASSIPVSKVLVVTAIGSCLALDRVDVLGEDARRHINNVVFYVYNPALVASKLAETITYDSMITLWFMPFNILITVVIGSIFGWIVVQFTRPPSHLRGLVVGCCAGGNLGNMFLILIPAVCKEKGSPFGSPDACQSYGLAYVSLSMAIGAIYLWSYVYYIMRESSVGSIKQSDQMLNGGSSMMASSTEPLLPSTENLASENYADRYALPSTKSDGKDERVVCGKLKENLRRVLGNVSWKTLLAPSTIAAILGFVIGVIPLLRKLMIGNGAPLRVIQDSASLLGDGAIPTLTLILGSNLVKGLQGSGVQKSMVFGIIVARYIALPLTGILVVKAALHFGFIPSDPLYRFVLHLQFAVPPAMNIGSITQLFGVGETECSVIMLWAYALASISLTLWSTFFMWFVA